MKEFKLNLGTLGYFISELTNLLKNTDKTQRVIVKEWRETRSLSQNSLYCVWMSQISEQKPLKCDSGAFKSSELWAEVFKKYYCPIKNITNGERSLPVQTTTLLDVGEMTNYLNKIESWCMDNGIKLTIPEDSEYYRLMEYQNR